MNKFIKYAIDFAVLTVVYFIWLKNQWKGHGRTVFAVNTLLYLYLTGVLFVTLMPIVVSLPFCFNHRYVPMQMTPFEDVWRGRGDFVRQILLNVIMTVPFGFLYPLYRRADGKSCSFFRCLLAPMTLSLTIELLQPLINGARSADITDVITNTVGGMTGYLVYVILWKILYKCFTRRRRRSGKKQV